MSSKTCTKCGETKDLSEFYKHTGSRVGYYARCKLCRCYATKEYMKDPTVSSKRSEYIKNWQKSKDQSYGMRNRLKSKSKRLGLPFDLKQEDIVIPDLCPVLGVPFEKYTLYAASVDRINPKLGYIKGNIQVICNKANTMKCDATPDELRAFARWVFKTYGEEDAA